MKKNTQLKTSEVIRSILMTHEEIESITIREFPPPAEFQFRFSPDDNDQELIKRGMALRESTRLPFPDAIIATALTEGKPSIGFLQALGYRNQEGTSYFLPRCDVLEGRLAAIEIQSRMPEFVGLSSLVSVGRKKELHIPQLDFHIPVSDRSLDLVERILQLIAPSDGWILDSGKSYHFWGNTLIEEELMLRFLSLSLLYAPFTDKNWISHQILKRACTLRLFGNPRTGAPAPVVVRELSRTPKAIQLL